MTSRAAREEVVDHLQGGASDVIAHKEAIPFTVGGGVSVGRMSVII